MTSKDLLYLGLLAVAALVCYCHGFFSGVSRARKVYEALMGGRPPGEPEPMADEDSLDATAGVNRAETSPPSWILPSDRSRRSGLGQDLHGDFGNN